MKKVLYFSLILILLLSVTFGAFACKSKVATGKAYYLYQYDSKSDSFVKSGTSLTFGENLTTFEYVFNDGGLKIYGAVEHTSKPDSYVITCSEEVVALVSERYRQTMVDGGADASQLDFYDTVAEGFSARAQYFSYDGKLFAGSAVELFREASKDSDSFEGVYRTDSTDDLMKLRGGYVYTADDDGEYTQKVARYSVSRGILTWISLDDKGKDRYQNGILMRKRYFMAKITIPTESELVDTSFEEMMEASPFVNKINTDISDYGGKTIAVLCESFLSYDMK